MTPAQRAAALMHIYTATPFPTASTLPNLIEAAIAAAVKEVQDFQGRAPVTRATGGVSADEVEQQARLAIVCERGSCAAAVEALMGTANKAARAALRQAVDAIKARGQ